MPPLDTSTMHQVTTIEEIGPNPSTATATTQHEHPVDSALLSFGQSAGGGGETEDPVIDPALFAYEQVVDDVRIGKVNLYNEGEGEGEGEQGVEEGQANAHASGSGGGGGQHDLEAEMMDEEFDPALREIVNSLTNAQQSTSLMGTNLTAAQAQAAIDAHLQEDHNHGLELKTLEDLERSGYGMMSDTYPSDPNFLLPEHEHDHEQPIAGPSHGSGSGSQSPPPTYDAQGNRREVTRSRRGRPKGSKNKPKPGRSTPPPPPRMKESKPRGRPRKKRTPEEEAEYERKRIAKEQGIKRPKGRPRKFPGYLVRDMRLKTNRQEYRELLRTLEDTGGDQHDHDHGHGHGHGYRSDMGGMDMDINMDMGMGMEGHDHDGGTREGEGNNHNHFWSENMERSILAAVEGLDDTHHNGGTGMEADPEEMPSSRAFEGDGGGEMEMRRVFGLPADTEGDGA